jgi:DNA-binding XRE family transcriptional regulator
LLQIIKVRKYDKIEQANSEEYIKRNKLPVNVKYYMCNKIKEHREKLGLTQQDVADMIGITRQSLALIEKGSHYPSILTSWMIAKVLNVELYDLFYVEEVEEDYYEKGK